MKIGIHQQAFGAGIGGSEFVIVTLAQMLHKQHQVEIVHQRTDLTVPSLADFFQVDLAGVRMRYLPPPVREWSDTACRPWKLRQEHVRWNAELSKPYDLFITITHGVPPYCHAPAGVLYVLFPTYDRRAPTPQSQARGIFPSVRRLVRRPFYDSSWRARFSTYQVKLAISQFSADWTRRYWGLNCEVVFPPVSIAFEQRIKRNEIVALGRFTPVKKQVELATNFRKVQSSCPDWSFTCLGALHSSAIVQQYFREVQAAAHLSAVRLVPDASRVEIRAALEGAKIFWHGMGLGVDETSQPVEQEHFGIATVEAMAAGCVPVVSNRGGQREIVEHGRSGFRCENLEEMAEYTIRLARDEKLRSQMAEAARLQATKFSREKFVGRFLNHLRPFGITAPEALA